ncbi:PAS domain-containing protein [Nissabacter sp. SGAir0207]|uniref:PAS domain-containing protein n=1 Tax=Nissabacter sp. SGAir0207 TaxID=2126321 RepID=UPI0010F6BE65|nr:PAS domain-containing protein [Nissabacter sp. SGAir0207]
MAARDATISSGRSQVHSLLSDSFVYSFFDSSPDAWCIRDSVGRFVYMNPIFAHCLGAKNASFLIGRKLEEMTTNLDGLKAKLFSLENDAILFSSKKTCIVPMLSPKDSRRVLSSAIFVPIKNPSGIYIGTCWQLCECNIFPFNSVKIKNIKLNEHDRALVTPYSVFSRKQWEIAWPLVMGWSKLDISISLGISADHVRKTTVLLYSKIGVNTFEEFQAKVIALEWLKEVPERTPYITNGY